VPSHRSALDNSAVAVVIPVKAFHQAKERLSDLLTPAERIVLAKYCADRVINAARDFDIFVVCDDPDVAQWARDHKTKIV
jgi:2-phospho-L-lactate guanylyltransferase